MHLRIRDWLRQQQVSHLRDILCTIRSLPSESSYTKRQPTSISAPASFTAVSTVGLDMSSE